MKAHKSLTRLDVLKYPAAKIASMVASEFLRAADKLHHPSIATNCLMRARELMGILETTPLNSEIALRLQPYYRQCSEERLRIPGQLTEIHLREFCLEAAKVFETVFISQERNSHA